MTQPPTYREANDSELPATQSDGVHTKSIIGGESPIHLVADVQVQHLTLEANASYTFGTTTERTDAIVVVSGELEVHDQANKQIVHARDFLVVEGTANSQLKASATGGEVVVVNVPTNVSYPLSLIHI